jgi:hypothetical protein
MAKKAWKSTLGECGKNVKYAVSDKGILTITVDLNVTNGPSASKKTMIIGTSEGNHQIDGGNGAVMGLNIYTKEGVK